MGTSKLLDKVSGAHAHPLLHAIGGVQIGRGDAGCALRRPG
jgi:hypothetical protein